MRSFTNCRTFPRCGILPNSFSCLHGPLPFFFAYGVHGLNRRYLAVPETNTYSPGTKFKNWWAKASGFDRGWIWFSAFDFRRQRSGLADLRVRKNILVRYLQKVGFGDEDMAQQIATFSIGQVGWFVVLFALSASLCALVIAGVFAGKRARLGGFLLGLLLVVDLGRADLPYIIHWDYLQKYASNPIIDFLRDKPYEHRVVGLPFNMPQQFALFEDLYRIEWMQHQFPYYNVQSLDVVQMPRIPADLEAFERALAVRNTPESMTSIARRWQLTNTRYLLGPAGFLDVMNEKLDPEQHRFHIVQRFEVVAKPGIEHPTQLEELTAVPTDNGGYALFEFTGALPRARLYSHWQVNTNDTMTLQTLASPDFDPWQTVLVSTPLPTEPAATNDNSGTVEFKSYAPKDIRFDTQAGTPAVLLLNDKFDPHWQVSVDGKPAGLLRCNFIMRGVYLPAGSHLVEFQFVLPNRPLYVSLAAIALGILLSGYLLARQFRANSSGQKLALRISQPTPGAP